MKIGNDVWLSKLVQFLKEQFTSKAELANRLAPVAAESQDGVAYTASSPWLTDLHNGMTLTIIPGRISNSTSPTLNLNGLGDIRLVRRVSYAGDFSYYSGPNAFWLQEGEPYNLTLNTKLYFGEPVWIVEGVTQAVAADIMSLDDYVESQSTAPDGWTVRVWHSGVYEAWLHRSETLQDSDQLIGWLCDSGAYQYLCSFDLPKTFTEPPQVFITLQSMNDLLNGYSPGNQAVAFSVMSNSGGNRTITYDVHIIGR